MFSFVAIENQYQSTKYWFLNSSEVSERFWKSIVLSKNVYINIVAAGHKNEYTHKWKCPNWAQLAIFSPRCHVTR